MSASELVGGSEHQVLKTLWRADLNFPDQLLRVGNKVDVEGRQWARLANKLSKPGSTVNVAAFGGSITTGYVKSNTSYPEQLLIWLRTAFPDVNFQLVNLARRATPTTFAALCLLERAPTDVDLVIVEYSVNGYGGQCQCFTDNQVAGYETLLRKAIKKAPQAAFLAYAAFMWKKNSGAFEPFYYTGEDQHAVVARRYSIPMVSVRDALYDHVTEESNVYGFNYTELFVDKCHPSEYGAQLYAAFAGWAIRHHVTKSIISTPSVEHIPMPKMISPTTASENQPGFCAEGEGLQSVLYQNQGWEFIDDGSNACEGCHKYGYTSSSPGSKLSLVIAADRFITEDHEMEPLDLIIFYVRSFHNVGKALLTCSMGCTCTPTLLEGKWDSDDKRSTEVFTQHVPLNATRGQSCILDVTILQETSTDGHRFKLSGLGMASASSVLSQVYGPVHEA